LHIGQKWTVCILIFPGSENVFWTRKSVRKTGPENKIKKLKRKGNQRNRSRKSSNKIKDKRNQNFQYGNWKTGPENPRAKIKVLNDDLTT
jgi:hypothetical protein